MSEWHASLGIVGWRRIPALSTALLALWIIDFYVSSNPRRTWWAVGHLAGLALLAAVAAAVGIRFPNFGVGLLAVVSSSAFFMGGSSPTGFGLLVLLLSVLAGAALLTLPRVFTDRATWPIAGVGAAIGVAAWAVLLALAG